MSTSRDLFVRTEVARGKVTVSGIRHFSGKNILQSFHMWLDIGISSISCSALMQATEPLNLLVYLKQTSTRVERKEKQIIVHPSY